MKSIIHVTALICASAFAFGSQANDAQDFYKGKNVTVIAGYAPGGGYDTTVRLLTRHMGKHIPGTPLLVPQNMPGAGSISAILYLYSAAPKDGSVAGIVSRAYAIEPLFAPDKARYDPKRFSTIGSTSREVSVGAVWHTTPFNSLSDLQERQIVLGATSGVDDTGRFPMVLKELTGAKIKVVTGYPGGNNILMAMETSEVEGRFGWSWGSVKSRSRQWLDEKKIWVIVQMALEKASDLPDVPNIMDFARNDLDRKAMELLFIPQAAACPLIAPPGVPQDRLNALRRAFEATMRDKDFAADAARLQVEVDPVTGEEMDRIVARTAAFDQQVVDHAQKLTKLD